MSSRSGCGDAARLALFFRRVVPTLRALRCGRCFALSLSLCFLSLFTVVTVVVGGKAGGTDAALSSGRCAYLLPPSHPLPSLADRCARVCVRGLSLLPDRSWPFLELLCLPASLSLSQAPLLALSPTTARASIALSDDTCCATHVSPLRCVWVRVALTGAAARVSMGSCKLPLFVCVYVSMCLGPDLDHATLLPRPSCSTLPFPSACACLRLGR